MLESKCGDFFESRQSLGPFQGLRPVFTGSCIFFSRGYPVSLSCTQPGYASAEEVIDKGPPLGRRGQPSTDPGEVSSRERGPYISRRQRDLQA